MKDLTTAPHKLSPRTALLFTPSSNSPKLPPSGGWGAEGWGTGDSEGIVSAYLTINPNTLDREALKNLGVQLCLEIGNTATARLPFSALAALSEVEGIEFIQTSAAAKPMMDVARIETNGAAMNEMEVYQFTNGENVRGGLTGKGVIVGVVDCGFDYAHAAFRNADGELRIKSVWEQGTTPAAGQHSPETFGYGVELTNAEEILAAGGDIRNNSHGTHVTSCAAGSSSHADGSLQGMASEADIVLVSMTEGGTDNVNISNAIAYIFDYADRAGQPCVVNLSLGSHSGPHDGTSTFDRIADALQGPGRLIVGAAGNHRADRFHIRRDFTEADIEKPLSTFIDYVTTPSSLGEDGKSGEIELWAAAEGSTLNSQLSTDTTPPLGIAKVALVLYKLSTGDETERAEVTIGTDEFSTLSLGRNVTGSFYAKAETSPLNGKLHILLQSAVTAIRTGYAIAIEVTPLSACALDIWADNTYLQLTSHDMEGFAAPTDNDPTICEIGGTANRILTVGAYTTRAQYKVYGSDNILSLKETDGEICSFSSYGPTADGRIKPNVTAPGAFINAAVSQYDNSGTITLSQLFNDNGVETNYGYMQGTSMSSPIVAGIVAAWLEANPTLTPEELNKIIQTTARKDSFTAATPASSAQQTSSVLGKVPARATYSWGYGKIDALAGAMECQRMTGICAPNNSHEGETTVRIYTTSGIPLNPNAPLPNGIYIKAVTTSHGTFMRKIARNN